MSYPFQTEIDNAIFENDAPYIWLDYQGDIDEIVYWCYNEEQAKMNNQECHDFLDKIGVEKISEFNYIIEWVEGMCHWLDNEKYDFVKYVNLYRVLCAEIFFADYKIRLRECEECEDEEECETDDDN
jgi:hypothetical protein